MKKLLYRAMMPLAIVVALTVASVQPAHAADLRELLEKLVGNGSHNLGTALINADLSARWVIYIIRSLSVVVGIVLLGQFVFRLIKSSDRKEQPAPSFYTLAAAVFLFSMMPSLEIVSKTMGFSELSGGTQLAMLESCKHLIATTCDDGGGALEAHVKGMLIAITTIVRMFGYVYFFKGIYAIYEMGGQGQGQKSIWRCLIMMAGGVMCINMVEFSLMIGNSWFPHSSFVEFFSGMGSVLLPQHLH